jgi:hypothetical protein
MHVQGSEVFIGPIFPILPRFITNLEWLVVFFVVVMLISLVSDWKLFNDFLLDVILLLNCIFDLILEIDSLEVLFGYPIMNFWRAPRCHHDDMLVGKELFLSGYFSVFVNMEQNVVFDIINTLATEVLIIVQ